MFLDFYELREQPFGETPDPRYIYLSPTHREAIASLAYGIKMGRGFLALVSEPGMGKTTVLFHLLESLRESASTAFLFQTQCNSRDLLCYLLADLGIDTHGRELAWIHEQLNKLLIREASIGRRVVVFIDEAHNLSESTLESVRLLSDFENPSSKLIQIVLAGQPQLAEKLARPELAQLSQRVSILSRISPFTSPETDAYIDHRLGIAGSKGRKLFTREARAMIAAWSQGVPRNINTLCFNALSLGYAMGKNVVDLSIVREATRDLELSPLARGPCDSQQTPAGIFSPAASASQTNVASPAEELSGASKTPQRTEFEVAVASASGRSQESTSAITAHVSRRIMVALGAALLAVLTADAGIFFMNHVIAQPALTKSALMSPLSKTNSQPAEGTPSVGIKSSRPRLGTNPVSGKRLDDKLLVVPTPLSGAAPDSTRGQVTPPGLRDASSEGSSETFESVLASSVKTLPATFATREQIAPTHVSDRVKAPRLTSRVEPIYPATARRANVEGEVVIDALIDITGRPTKLQVLSGPTLLQRAALDAVREWHYEPSYLGDKPVPVGLYISVNFRLH
jgi:TonB family protein